MTIRFWQAIKTGDHVARKIPLTSVVHEQSEQQNDRQRDADQPKQSTFSKRHRSLHYSEGQHFRVPLVPFEAPRLQS
jgi:hypothetical protein